MKNVEININSLIFKNNENAFKKTKPYEISNLKYINKNEQIPQSSNINIDLFCNYSLNMNGIKEIKNFTKLSDNIYKDDKSILFKKNIMNKNIMNKNISKINSIESILEKRHTSEKFNIKSKLNSYSTIKTLKISKQTNLLESSTNINKEKLSTSKDLLLEKIESKKLKNFILPTLRKKKKKCIKNVEKVIVDECREIINIKKSKIVKANDSFRIFNIFNNIEDGNGKNYLNFNNGISLKNNSEVYVNIKIKDFSKNQIYPEVQFESVKKNENMKIENHTESDDDQEDYCNDYLETKYLTQNYETQTEFTEEKFLNPWKILGKTSYDNSEAHRLIGKKQLNYDLDFKTSITSKLCSNYSSSIKNMLLKNNINPKNDIMYQSFQNVHLNNKTYDRFYLPKHY